MKKYLVLLPLLGLATACYDSYVNDYEYSAAYITYQFDLRSFILDDTEQFDFTVCLGGVINNDHDRVCEVALVDSLVYCDLKQFSLEETSFTALDGLRGNTLAAPGTLSGGVSSYVQKAFADASIDALVPLPKDCYTISEGNPVIRKGRHTGTLTIRATDAIRSHPEAFGLNYALGFHLKGADADTLFLDKTFEIIAIRCEHRFYGSWYHGGKTVTPEGTDYYPLVLPQVDFDVCTLTTLDANTVVANMIGHDYGQLYLTVNGDEIEVSSPDVEIVPDGRKSSFNGAKLLQERELYLNYSYKRADGEVCAVTDTLLFRNRIRDGINEWQDENPEHYR